MNKDTYIGVDLGGTKLLIGEIDCEKNIIRQQRYASGYCTQPEAVELIKRSLADFMAARPADAAHPQGIGVGLIGRVDNVRGVWEQIDPERTNPVCLASELRQQFGLPCFIDNDVKSATRAEMVWGYGQKSDNFVYINVGTGIAAGMVVDGVQVRGSHFNAGEVGHVRSSVSLGVDCVCGRTDCVEAIASGSGIDKCARLLASQYKTSLNIPAESGDRVSVSDVFKLYKEGDELCQVLVNNAADALANLIMNLVRVSDPDTVVLGGGVVADGFMLSQIMPRLQAKTMRFVTNGVVLTELDGRYVGVMGAAALAMK